MADTWLRMKLFLMRTMRTEKFFFCSSLLDRWAVVKSGHCSFLYFLPKHQYLQVRAKERLPLGVLVVVPHQQVEQRRCFCPEGGQLGDAALKHLAAQGLAQCHAALEEHWWELARQRGCVRFVWQRPRGAKGEARLWLLKKLKWINKQ